MSSTTRTMTRGADQVSLKGAMGWSAVRWARIVQRLLALNSAIWHDWLIGAPVKRSLVAYDHC
jgi:hypothetical protein